MNQLNDKLLELIMMLDEIQSDSLDHDRRKKLLLEIHHLKVESRKEQADAVTNELMALEYSFGFGKHDQAVAYGEIHEHRQRLSELAGVSEPDDVPEPDVITDESEFDASEIDDSGIEGSEIEGSEIEEPVFTSEETDTEEMLSEESQQIELIPSPEAPIHLTLCNCKSRDEARELAYGLIEHRLAACVNFVANIGAIYRWQDNIEDTSECQLQIKSVPERDEEIKDYIKAHHSYDVPEIITVPVHQANQEYIQWVIQQTTP